MLPKPQRFSRDDFSKRPVRQAAFAFGSLKMMPGSGRGSVVVSKKVAASAVTRNTLRRRIYAVLRPLLKNTPASVIVYPNKKALDASFTELKAALEAVL